MGSESHSEAPVGARAAASAGLLVASRLITRCIDLITLSLLGRLLTPADFGIVAIAMSVIFIVEAVMEIPIGVALIRVRNPTKRHYDTAFTVGLLRSCALMVVVTALSWLIAELYRDERLIWLIAVLGTAPAVRSLGSPRITEFTRRMDYRPIVALEAMGKLTSLVVSVVVAWCTGSYWAIAVGTIATPLTIAVASHIAFRYRPRLSLAEWGEFSAFVRWSTINQLVGAMNWQIDQLMLGRMVSRQDLGRFSMASNLASLPTQVIIVQLLNPLTVAFSLIRDNPTRLKDAYRASAAMIVCVGLPVLIGLGLVADPLIRLVLGEKWIVISPIVAFMALSIIPSLFVSPLSPLLMSLNRTQALFPIALSELLFKMPILLVAIWLFGMEGAVGMRMLTAVFVAAVSMRAAQQTIGWSAWKQVAEHWRSIVASAVMAAAVYPFTGDLEHEPQIVLMAAKLLGAVLLAAAVYAVAILALWFVAGRPTGAEAKIVNLVRSFIRR
ncbi:lipopolysaccharide biosynthesis protein [Rhodopseudomonas palustris]|uniref:lipopolysaccharide biosynthesis protein n=1 Tax=Rhodopseudomonas palustris TaxID=1076 RepID=UPI000E5AC373|nr:lipopolysaccharide biosynthesis protein [Rhodopseudomonas palustris]QLH72367.1 lipopolysaccharide biosynthesis protein [Rhodopseudomonas palustris]RHZ95379.1 lipopolysaccharide biosynthesis protein [Rhodopseudomonas palustris]